jgi:hypothetical protein
VNGGPAHMRRRHEVGLKRSVAGVHLYTEDRELHRGPRTGNYTEDRELHRGPGITPRTGNYTEDRE